MSVSEHANYLLNEYGRLQFDYAAYYKPYGEALRNEARNNLETYIAELEGLVDELIEAGESMSLAVECENQIEANAYYSWKELVKDWKEREE